MLPSVGLEWSLGTSKKSSEILILPSFLGRININNVFFFQSLVFMFLLGWKWVYVDVVHVFTWDNVRAL